MNNVISLFVLLVFLYPNLKSQSTGNFPVETVLQSGHTRDITCLAFSPDGNFLVTGSYDNTIKLWNMRSGKEIRSFTHNTEKILSVYFHPSGNKILSAGDDNRAIVYDIFTGKPLTKVKIKENQLQKACFSPKGDKILTMDNRDGISVWEAHSAKLIGTYKKSYAAEITPQWFSPDGSKLITYHNYKEAKLIDIETSNEIQTFPFDKPFSFAYSPDGKKIIIGSEKLFAKIFDTETGKEILNLKDNENIRCDGCKTHVSYSHNGKFVATGSRRTGVSVWNAKTGKKLVNFSLENNTLDNIRFSPGNKYIIATCDDISYVLNISSGEKTIKTENKGISCRPVIGPEDKYLLSWGINHTAILWDIQKKKQVNSYKGFRNKTRDDGLNFEQGNWFQTGIIRSLNITSSTTLSNNGKYLVKGKTDSIAIMIDLETGKKIREFHGHKKVILASCFSHDGKTLATAGGDRGIILWNAETGEIIRKIYENQELIFDIKFSSDDNYIISGSWDGTLRIFDAKTGERSNYIKFDKVSPYKIEYTPGDLYIISSDLGGRLKLWEVDTGEEFREFIGHKYVVTDMCFSMDKKKLITSSLDGKVKVWDILTGMQTSKFTRHSSEVYSVESDPKGRFIVSGGNDRKIRVWEMDTGKELKVLEGHSSAISSLHITPNGEKLISSTVDGSIKVWDLNSFEEIYTYIQLDRDNWLVKNPAGYFDGSNKALSAINYVSGLKVIPVGSLFEKYYIPNLLQRINQGEKFTAQNKDIGSVIAGVPSIEMIVTTENRSATNTLGDSLEWYTPYVPISINIADQGGGVDELRIYNNGKLIHNEKTGSSHVKPGKKYSLTIEVPVTTGKNELTAIAINKDRAESQPARLNVYRDGLEPETSLYILSVGIDKYINPNYELSYAIKDSKAYSGLIKKGARHIFKNIEEFHVKDHEANKEGIKKVFQEIAEKAEAEDVFIFYFAGHGAMSSGEKDQNSNFFIIPYDVTQLYGNDKLLEEKAISTAELLNLSKEIAARKQMFILDACQAGGALEALNTRGANREKAIAQLARSTGTFFLLASGAVQFASEAKELGHGIFTYALLEGLGGKADGGNQDKKITANELKSYVEDRVPEITNEYMLTPQYPTGYGFGQDFPIVLIK